MVSVQLGGHTEGRLRKEFIWREVDKLHKLKDKQKVGKDSCQLLVKIFNDIANYQEGIYIMAGKQKSTKVIEGWAGFVDIPLSDSEKAMYVDWDVHDEDLWILVADLIGSGYKMSVSHNDKNSTFIAAFTCKAEGSANSGYTLSAFAGTWYEAIRVLIFKHAIVAQGDWKVNEKRVVSAFG